MSPALSYIDAHCHLADPRIGAEVSRLLAEAEGRGIGAFIQGGVDPEDWKRQIELKKAHPGKILTAFGLHPWWVAAHSEKELDRALDELSGMISQADALGEIGLDHSTKFEVSTYSLQETAFRRQLDLGRSVGKPVVFHVVRAHPKALELIREAGFLQLEGLVHSFSGSKEIAKKYLDLGLTLSISGVLTRKGFETLRRAVSYIPLDRLVLETDSPDQKPADWDRTWNEPLALFRVAEAVGAIRGVKPQELLEKSSANLRRMFAERI